MIRVHPARYGGVLTGMWVSRALGFGASLPFTTARGGGIARTQAASSEA
jgi:hypothetical protein